MTIQELMNRKSWVNPNTGVERFYVAGSKRINKARVFFSETLEKAAYTWKAEGGFFHADKCYNGCIIEELQEMFPEENIVEV